MMSLFKLEYKSFGRSGMESILIEKRTLIYINNQQDTLRKKLRKKPYGELYILLSRAQIDSLEFLSVPSKRHQVDGALAATLIVTDMNSKEYRSPIFDADNPPEKIKELIAYIKELAEK